MYLSDPMANPEDNISQSSSQCSTSSEGAAETNNQRIDVMPDSVVMLETCSQVYFAGYIAHRYYNKYKCIQCLGKMCDLRSKLSSRKELLLLNRSFTTFKVDETSGLLAPSESLLYVVDAALKIFKIRYKSIAHKRHIVRRLLNSTSKIVSFGSLTCANANCFKNEDFVVRTLFRILIQKQCKWISSSMKTSALDKLKVLKHV